MYQREIFRIGSPSIPTCVYVHPYESSVSYQYPYQVVVVRTDDRHDAVSSDTRAMRQELSQIKSDISELKRRYPSPTYHAVKQDHSNETCLKCNSSSSRKYPKQYLKNPVYFCQGCHSFVEERTYPVESTFRTKVPAGTYYDSYQRLPTSSGSIQHSRPWIPTASKNAYPNRRWNLSEPHPEP